MAEDKANKSAIAEIGNDDMTDEQRAAIAAQAEPAGEQAGTDRVLGYILSPDALVALLDICEDIPYRYSKKIVPALQGSSQLVEGADGTAKVIQPNRG